MRSNEVFETDILCQASPSCDKVSTQCVDISLPMTVTPVAGIGTVTTSCQGVPAVTCVTADDRLSCTLTVTQRVCLNIPVRFSAVAESASPSIACAESGNGSVCLL